MRYRRYLGVWLASHRWLTKGDRPNPEELGALIEAPEAELQGEDTLEVVSPD